MSGEGASTPARAARGTFQALDRSALRPATSGREGLSDGLLLHPHTIVSMLINDLADIDNEVFLFLDDCHSVTDPAIRGAASFLLGTPHHIDAYNALGATLSLGGLLAKNRLLEVDYLCVAL
jgi:LuxR family transcriptional regulator, maltose regulon positive regulatory protein